MANPQRENGHIDIANEIAEALAQYRLSGTEWQVLWVILRHTWGWHKKEEFISYGVIAEKTGLLRVNVIRAVQALTEKNILMKNGDNLVNHLKFNKDYESWKGWKVVSKMIPVGSIKNDTSDSIKNDTSGSIKNDTTSIYVLKKDKENIKEKKIYKEKKEQKKRYLDFIMLTETEHKKLVDRLGEDKTNEMIENLNYYIGSKGRQYKSHYFTILQWVASDKKRIAEKQGEAMVDSVILKKSEQVILCKKCKRFPQYLNSLYCLNCISIVQAEELEKDKVMHPEKYMHGLPKRFIAWDKSRLLPHYQKLLEMNIESRGLYLEGIQGSGKTCFITVFGKEFVRKFGQDIWFVNAVSLMYEVKGTFDKESKFFNDYDVIMKYAQKPILVIDDLGSEKASDYVRQSFYALINHRYLEDLKTFITSFYSLEHLAARYDASIASRIAEMCENVDMGNTDLRLQRRVKK